MGERPSRRGPTVATLRSIERILREADSALTRYQIRQVLPKKIAAHLLDEALAYLRDHGLVEDAGPGHPVRWRDSRRHRTPEASPVPHARPNLARLVRRHRRAILDLAARHGVAEVRLFGSVARGEESSRSDVDFLIRMAPGRTLLDHIAFKQDVEEILGVRVDAVSEGGLSPYIRESVLAEAVAL